MLNEPRFAALAASNTASLLAYAGVKVIVGWVVLELTSSALLVALGFALLMLPRLLFGLQLGVLIDHVDRRLANALSCVAAATLCFTMAWLSNPHYGVAVFLVAAFLLGLLESIRLIAVQTLIYDIVTPARATAAIALSNFIGHLGQAVGALLIGLLMTLLGSGASLVAIAIAYVLGAALTGFRQRSPSIVTVGRPVGWTRFRRTLRTGLVGLSEAGEIGGPPTAMQPQLRLATGAIRSTMVDPTIRLLAVFGITLEILGFSSNALYPVLAGNFYFVGASGLGAMNAVRSFGGALGLLALALIATRVATIHRGLLLVAFGVMFGAALALLGITREFVLALLLLFLVGIAAASVDTLLQVLMQTVGDRRGSAMGVWVWTVGFGPVGQIEVGAIATILGAQIAMGINGLLLIGVCLFLASLRGTRRLT